MAQSWRIYCAKTVDDDVFSMTMLNYVRLREDNGIPGYHENTTATPKKIVFKCFQDVMQSHLFYPFWVPKILWEFLGSITPR